MGTMTLSGRAAPDSEKRIDVDANLLGEWLSERSRLHRGFRSRALGILAIAIVGSWGVGALAQSKAAISKRAAPVAQRLKAVEADYAAIAPDSNGDSAAAISTMLDETKKKGDAFVGQIIAMMNSAPPTIALSSLKADILGGEEKLTGQADAETFYAANEFIQHNNSPEKGMNATQISTSRSDVLAPGGVSFQFVKSMRVGP